MEKISFIDNNYIYVRSVINREYTEINKIIEEEKETYNYYNNENGRIVAYKISINEPLKKIYNFNFWVVRFYFANCSALHDENQEMQLEKMIAHLNDEMQMKGGYYNLRIPSHLVDLVRCVNRNMRDSIFCGGTVEEYIVGKKVNSCNKSELNIFIPEKEYILEKSHLLMDMTYESFKMYQGQYHISHVTDSAAGEIYKNWISDSIMTLNHEHIVVAEYEGEPIGFVTFSEDDFSVEGILSSVSAEKRKLGAYKAMISFLVNYANDNNKAFITSTQFDNYIVQGAWNTIGLRPFYSIYNFHVDYRN